MIKKIKKGSYKSSANIILACLIAAIAVSMNSVMAKGAEVNSGNVISTSVQHEFIIDAPVKFYTDIKKIESIVNFKFKVPDYLPNGNKVGGFQVRKLSQKDNALEIFIQNSNGSFSFVASNRDPVEILEKIECEKTKTIENSKVESKKEPMKLGGITGVKVTLITTLPCRQIGNEYSKESKKSSEYFIWKNENTWYGLEYNSSSESEETSSKLVSISEDDIMKIAESIKIPDEVKNINYIVDKGDSEENSSVYIYQREDFQKAKALLGFDPKFPLKINQDINITGSIVSLSENSDAKNNKISYSLSNFYSNKNGSITFTAQGSSKNYEDIMKQEVVTNQNNSEEVKSQEIKAEKLKINNNDVYKYTKRGIVSEVNYLWKENDIYYSVTFFVNTENSDEIFKLFINSKTLD